MTSRLEQLKFLGKRFFISNYVRAGLHSTHDGVIHELAHLVCQGMPASTVCRLLGTDSRYRTPDGLEILVEDTLRQYTENGGDSDADECRVIATSVHALRQLRCVTDTKYYITHCVSTTVMDPSKARQVERALTTKVSKKRGDDLLELVDMLYQQKKRACSRAET